MGYIPKNPDPQARILRTYKRILRATIKKNRPLKLLMKYMDVSENSGTPKSFILIGFSIIDHPFWGTPISGDTHIPNGRPSRKILHGLFGLLGVSHGKTHPRRRAVWWFGGIRSEHPKHEALEPEPPKSWRFGRWFSLSIGWFFWFRLNFQGCMFFFQGEALQINPSHSWRCHH